MEKVDGLPTSSPFNTPLEIGLRALILLVEAYPRAIDLQRLVQYDYITLHSEDAGGPPSLHPPLPLRSGELTVRRSLIENGLLLMISRGLVTRLAQNEDGFVYQANDAAGPFTSNLRSSYVSNLQDLAKWTIANFGDASQDKLRELTMGFFKHWSSEFDSIAPTQTLFDGI